MDIITTHTNADLDALASMVAAQKLYPGSIMVFPGALLKNVEEFMALHKDTIYVRTIRDIAPELVEKLILVDTKTPSRLGKLAYLLDRPGVEVHIYDHHPRSEGDATGRFEVVEMVGATTTLLVEKIREKRLQITPVEATVLALGIYEDTGSLVFSNTTPRDAEAVAYTLANGANLAVVANFLWRPLTEEQRELLKALLVSAERYNINGIKFLIAEADLDQFVGGLDLLTHKLVDFANLEAVFTVVKMDGCVHVVARSSVPEVSVKDILGMLGGGGHPAAASAVIKNSQVADVVKLLLAAIRQKVKPPVSVADIMSSPVKTVAPETVIEEAGRIMLRYGHTGLPVIKDEQVVGVISRRDVEKAVHHGLGHAPVKGFMTGSLVSVGPEATVAAVRELMIEHDIGRLPVLQEGKLVGIVSRTDVLRTLHGDVQSKHYKVYSEKSFKYHYKNIRELIYRSLPEAYITILEQVGTIANELGCRVFAAGGIVRDLLLGVESLDLDLVVEGDGVEMARALGRRYDARVRVHPKFRTATVLFPDGRQVDVATARVEFYQHPAAMPQIETSSLHQDLYRRDFTINAMAVSLNQNDFGDIIDYFGGREDLERGLVRVLHNLSFVEDPTRLLRGVRFEKRYAMNLEPQTFALAKEAVRSKMLERVAMERVWEELKHILSEPRPGLALYRLQEIGLWDYLFPGVDYKQVRQVLDELPRSLRVIHTWDLAEQLEPWLAYLLALLSRSDADTAGAICRRYHLGQRWTDRVHAGLSGWQDVADSLQRAQQIQMSDLARRLMPLPEEVCPLILTRLTGNAARAQLRQVLSAINYDQPSITGKDLSGMGFTPGPAFKLALDAVWQARLDGLVRTRQEELSYAREYLAAYEGVINSV
ncbi:Multifunctional CCA protein [Pelotomaculum schinkii]|uniref:Multifunctional CCA protein n=1 Tax=Pelotomaculum schinkii TaxID=78350 RepID=A0A4Y7RD10_9FIRM|nr:CBS domain-containing protein [Pelotomaculum schinkii]TEB06712.1 Multifunctional CCA protein [Pelotomaculum schinkii]